MKEELENYSFGRKDIREAETRLMGRRVTSIKECMHIGQSGGRVLVVEGRNPES